MPSWDDADERSRPAGYGGDWRGSKPSFDDPMSWSFPVMRIAGITVRLHVLFLVFVVVVLAQSASVTTDGSIGVLPALLALAALFLVILTHEFGHCIACRAKGGSASEVLLWPLGGLASCSPPERPDAHLWTAIGGPLVNVGFIAVLTPWIGLESGQWWGRAIPNPLDLAGLVQRADFGEDLAGWLRMFVLLTNYIAWVLLLFNLIPMFPLDGGRILQALLWRRMGHGPSMRFACRAGIVGAVAIGVGALIGESTMILGIAIFGGFTCVATARQLESERDFLGYDPDPSELASVEEEIRRDEPRRPATPRPEEAELDRILDKIARSGIESLSESERKALQRATDEKRGRER
jgi:stage IV sporulation protein FB